MTKEEMTSIGQSIMQDALRGGTLFAELKRIKVEIQTIAADSLSQSELMDVALSRKNETVIDKLVAIGKGVYERNKVNNRLYMTAMAIGTIIKEYEWGDYYTHDSGLLEMINRLT